MGAQPLHKERLIEAVGAFERFGSQASAANFLGVSRTTLQHRLYEAKRLNLIPEPAPVEPAKIIPHQKPKVRIQAAPAGTALKVLAIGDAHDDPSIPKSRFRWLGKHAADIGCDYVVQIGDFCTLDSLNSHIPNHTLAGKQKNPFSADMESFEEALGEFKIGLGSHKPKLEVTLGNHERRAWLYEDQNPESQGLLTGPLTCLLEQYGWGWREYGEFLFLGSVGFVHAALNRLGKTYGGKNAEQTIANDAVFDIVIGHSHTGRSWRAPKIGPSQFVNVVNLGCALPQGHVEDYALHATTGWTWGCHDLTIRSGHIEDNGFVSMTELERRHG